MRTSAVVDASACSLRVTRWHQKMHPHDLIYTYTYIGVCVYVCVCVCECVCVCYIYVYIYIYIYIYSIRKFIHTALRVSNSLSSKTMAHKRKLLRKIKRQVNVNGQASKWPGQRRAKRKQSTRRKAETLGPTQFYSLYSKKKKWNRPFGSKFRFLHILCAYTRAHAHSRGTGREDKEEDVSGGQRKLPLCCEF